jgi:hypothetical protein
MNKIKNKKIIHALWDSNLEDSPEVVKNSILSWKKFAPNYEINILNKEMMDIEISQLNIKAKNLKIQAKSDLLRAKLLNEKGGLWLDATCLLTEPLDGWLDEYTKETDFFTPQWPEEKRPIASWFMYSTENNPLIKPIIPFLENFLNKDRELYSENSKLPNFYHPIKRHQRKKAIKYPEWAMDPNKGAAKTSDLPYFFFHYSFLYKIKNDEVYANMWNKIPPLPAKPALMIGHIEKTNILMDKFSTNTQKRILNSSPMHKLNWRKKFPDWVYQNL